MIYGIMLDYIRRGAGTNNPITAITHGDLAIITPTRIPENP